MHRDKCNIVHAHNSTTEQRVGPYLIDGTDKRNRVLYEYNGRYWHEHNCPLNDNEFNDKCGVPMSVLYERTLQRKRYLDGRGYTVVFMWECECKHMRKTDEDLKELKNLKNLNLLKYKND